MYEVHTFLLVNVVSTCGDIVFSELNSDSTRRGGMSKPLSQQNSKPVPIKTDFLPRGCGDDQDFCEVDTNYPDINTIKRIVRANSSELELKLLFSSPDFPALTYSSQANQPIPISNIFEKMSSGRPPPPAGNPAQPASTSVQEQGRVPLPETDEVSSSDTTVILDNDIATRFGGSLQEETAVCVAHESFIYPKTAKNIAEEWRFVVNVEDENNSDDNFRQAVRIERCSREGESCDINTVRGIKTVCRQKYSEKKLVAISPEGEKYVDTFRLPSCCICYKKVNFRLELSSQDTSRGSFISPAPIRTVGDEAPANDPAAGVQIRGEADGSQETGFGAPKSVEEFDDPLEHDFINFGVENEDRIIEEKMVERTANRRHKRNL